jgi:hypothetical protein
VAIHAALVTGVLRHFSLAKWVGFSADAFHVKQHHCRTDIDSINLHFLAGKLAKTFDRWVYFKVYRESSPSPELFCVELKRHPRDLGISIVLPATCDLMARREVFRLFPEYRHSLVLMQVSLTRYVEIDWESGRCLVIKRNRRREVPAAVAEISKSLMKKPPRLEEEGDAQ